MGVYGKKEELYPCKRRRQPITVPVLCLPIEQDTRIGKFEGLMMCYVTTSAIGGGHEARELLSVPLRHR